MRIDAVQQYLGVRFEALDKAVALARTELNLRLEHLNEWKMQNSEERRTFATQVQVDRLQQWVDRSGGRWQALTIGSVILSIITMAVTIVRLLPAPAMGGP